LEASDNIKLEVLNTLGQHMQELCKPFVVPYIKLLALYTQEPYKRALVERMFELSYM
jgi:hypothetical protein